MVASQLAILEERAQKNMHQAHEDRHRSWHAWQAVEHANSYEILRYKAESDRLIEEEKRLRDEANVVRHQGDFKLEKALLARANSYREKNKKLLKRLKKLEKEIIAAQAEYNLACRTFDEAEKSYFAAKRALGKLRARRRDPAKNRPLAVSSAKR